MAKRALIQPLSLLLLAALPALAQRPHPARWELRSAAPAVAPGGDLLLELRLALDDPWHMYSLTTPKGGPIITTIVLEDSPAIASFEVFAPPAQRKFDPNFQIETETYEKEVSFWIKARVAPAAPAGPAEMTARMRYQLCTDKECLPPRRITAVAKVEVKPGAAVGPATIPADYQQVYPLPASAEPPSTPGMPVPQATPAGQSLASFLLVAAGFGFAAIFTPCVFPMIPITMSFFLQQSGGGRGRAVTQALVFCLGIMVLFTAIGLGLSAALGPFAVVQLGSNPYVNGLISAVFLVFALSLLGAFEITLPSGLLTRLNAASNQGGYMGSLIMGLTFCLAAFACVGPFMGTLLAASVGGDRLQPALGMLAFSAALSSPFFLLALFPSFLSRLPRSGGWMSRVKIVLGFLLLAALLKYLSNIDAVLGWGLLTRERFLALWSILFALPGLYLLGFLRMEGIRADQPVGVGRLLLGTLFLGFALSLLPGMFGARLGELDAYVPAPSEQSSFAPGGSTAPRWAKNDLSGAIERARGANRLVLVAFTGYACTNCHWMKANMFTRPEIQPALANLELVELYTDGTDAVSEANQQFQEKSFQTVAIPFYALLDADQKVVASFAGLTKDPAQFLRFLESKPSS